MGQIKEIRKKLSLTQAELALFLSIPRSTLSLAETGLRPLKMNDRHRLAELEMAMSGPDQTGNDPLLYDLARPNGPCKGKYLEARYSPVGKKTPADAFKIQ